MVESPQEKGGRGVIVDVSVVGCPSMVVVIYVGMGESYVMVSVVACPAEDVVSVVTQSWCGVTTAGVLVGWLTGGHGQVGGSMVAVMVVRWPPILVVMVVS